MRKSCVAILSDVITFNFRFAAILWMDAVAIDIPKRDSNKRDSEPN